jgi:hypothetical protein
MLLLGIHPLMGFLPFDVATQHSCCASANDTPHYQVVPLVGVEIAPDGTERLCLISFDKDQDADGECVFSFYIGPTRGDGVRSGTPKDKSVTSPHCVRLEGACVRGFGVPCPFVVVQREPHPDRVPPSVLTNLERLLQADRWLKLAEQLSRAGRFAEAVDCFQQVHLLVPGTNLQARAIEGTREVLVKLYGTTTEPGAVDEESEARPAASALPHGAKAPTWACPNATPGEEACPKARTIVYPVADLLGRGKETSLDDLEELMTVIAGTVEPKSWAENGGEGTMESYYRCRALVIRQTPAAHEQIAELLAGLREARAQAGSGDAKPHRAAPTGRTAKADSRDGCCERCAKDKGCRRPCHEVAGESACEECCPMPVLTLPQAPVFREFNSGPHLELIIEGCTDQGPVAASLRGLRCTIGGACAEADLAAEGPRWRCQIPFGPWTAVVRYEHREFSVGIGLASPGDANSEESESHEQ